MTAPRSYPPQRRPGTQPVYRTRNHAYTCRCGQCPQSRPGDWGIIAPLVLFGGLAALIGFWPAMIVHGQTDTGGWRWDIHSTYACLAWWGGVIFVAVLIAVANRTPKPKVPAARTVADLKPPPPSVCVPSPPLCMHLGAVKVDDYFGKALHVWCPGCDPECRNPLPANFRWLCCGAEPGTLPGAPHVYNCPQRLKEVTP